MLLFYRRIETKNILVDRFNKQSIICCLFIFGTINIFSDTCSFQFHIFSVKLQLLLNFHSLNHMQFLYKPCNITYVYCLRLVYKMLGSNFIFVVACKMSFLWILLTILVVVLTQVVRMNPWPKQTPTHTYLESGFNNSMIMSET